MRIATWNVNSVRVRQTHVRRWLERVRPDIVVLQEIKCEAHAFPAAVFADLGYKSEVVGQKAYNGVAALSHRDIVIHHRSLPGLPAEDTQARYIEVETEGLTVIGIYLPNGNSGGEAGYAYKLAWMEALCDRAEALLAEDRDLIITGDFNVCPTGLDFAAGALAPTDALLRPETRARFRRLVHGGLTDAVRALHPHAPAYSFWDYQAGCWERDRGLRIDFALLSPRLAECLVAAAPDRDERGAEQPSDHVPVVVDLSGRGTRLWPKAEPAKMPLNGVRALVFDTFGTTVDWRTGVAREAASFLSQYGSPHIDPAEFADAWRRRYGPAMENVRSGRRPFTRLDVLHRENLAAVLSDFGIDPARIPAAALDALNLAWHRLDPWPDSVAGLHRLRQRFIIAPLSNGNIILLTNMAKRAGIPWDVILGAEVVQAYKPTPESYVRTADVLGMRPEEIGLVAAHNGDLAAGRACGLKTLFVPRPTEHGPGQTTDLCAEQDWDVVALSFGDLADQLGL